MVNETKKNMATTYTPEQVQKEADFLLGWAKSKTISQWGDATSSFYSKGKLMCQLKQDLIAELLKAGLATGTQRSFVMVKPVKVAKAKKVAA